jgi:hypothetical protein
MWIRIINFYLIKVMGSAEMCVTHPNNKNHYLQSQINEMNIPHLLRARMSLK